MPHIETARDIFIASEMDDGYDFEDACLMFSAKKAFAQEIKEAEELAKAKRIIIYVAEAFRTRTRSNSRGGSGECERGADVVAFPNARPIEHEGQD